MQEISGKILARVSKWTEISPHTLKEMYASDENGGLDTAQIMRFDKALQHKFSVGKRIEELYREVNQ